jgi:hypothetical protein
LHPIIISDATAVVQLKILLGTLSPVLISVNCGRG